MATLFQNMPGMNTVRNVAANAVGNSGRLTQSGGMSNYILYGLLIAVIVLIYLLLTGYKLSVKSIDFRSEKWKSLDHAKTFWTKGMGGVSNLRITDDDLFPEMDSKYTFHFDLLLANTRNLTNIEGPYRHIFHRGSSELYSEGSASGNTSINKYEKAPAYGLPKRLNPGIFLDPNTNDIIVFIDTKSPKGDVYRESGRISDIPVDKPLRFTVSLHNKVLEIDLNCKLELTKVLAGDPRKVENVVYGLCGQSAAAASMQNLYVWPYAITNYTLLNFCPMPFPPFMPPADTCGAKTDPSLMPPDQSDITNSRIPGANNATK